MKIEGTEFQKKVWNEIMKIPRGEIKTYKQIAELIGNPRSYRAVANACGKNPHPIAIPCHRVIKRDGQLGGYGGGNKLKKKLLELEVSSS